MQNVDGSITRRLVTWEREDWPFELATEVSVAAATSEVPSALAISKQGFVVTENASTHGSVELQWMSAQSPGVPVPGHITSEFLADVQAMRKCFFPEKVRREKPFISLVLGADVLASGSLFYILQVAWLYEQLHRRQAEAMMEVVPMEFATAYPHSVLRDSLGLLTKISPLQVLMSRYKIQFVAARSHTRANAVAGDIEESWLKALFAEFRNPENGVLMPCDDGSLDLASYALRGHLVWAGVRAGTTGTAPWGRRGHCGAAETVAKAAKKQQQQHQWRRRRVRARALRRYSGDSAQCARTKNTSIGCRMGSSRAWTSSSA